MSDIPNYESAYRDLRVRVTDLLRSVEPTALRSRRLAPAHSTQVVGEGVERTTGFESATTPVDAAPGRDGTKLIGAVAQTYCTSCTA